jgi:hypothetical protein
LLGGPSFGVDVPIGSPLAALLGAFAAPVLAERSGARAADAADACLVSLLAAVGCSARGPCDVASLSSMTAISAGSATRDGAGARRIGTSIRLAIALAWRIVATAIHAAVRERSARERSARAPFGIVGAS